MSSNYAKGVWKLPYLIQFTNMRPGDKKTVHFNFKTGYDFEESYTGITLSYDTPETADIGNRTEAYSLNYVRSDGTSRNGVFYDDYYPELHKQGWVHFVYRSIDLGEVEQNVRDFLVNELGAIALPDDPTPEVNNDRIYRFYETPAYNTAPINCSFISKGTLFAGIEYTESSAVGVDKHIRYIDGTGVGVVAGYLRYSNGMFYWSKERNTVHWIDQADPPFNATRMRAISGRWTLTPKVGASGLMQNGEGFTIYSAEFDSGYAEPSHTNAGVYLQLVYDQTYPAHFDIIFSVDGNLILNGTYPLGEKDKLETPLMDVDFGPTALIPESEYQIFRKMFLYLGPTSKKTYTLCSDGEFKPVAPVYKCIHGEKVRL